MPQEIYTPEQKATLEKGVKMMLDNGASKEDVMKYATAYRDKYAVKKKVQSGNSTMENGGLGSEDPLKNPPPSKYQYVDPQTFDEANLPEAKFQPKSKAVSVNTPTNKPKYITPEAFDQGNYETSTNPTIPQGKSPNGDLGKTLTSKQDLDAQLSKVNSELIDKEEEFVVPQLKQQFGDLGFKFEETGIGDAVNVTAPNGQKLTVNLDPFTSKTEKGQAEELKKFIKANAKPDKLTRLMANQDKYNQKIISEEEVKNSILTIRQEETQMAAQYQKLAEDQQLLSNAKIRKGLMERKDETNTQEYQDLAKYVTEKEAYVDRLQSQLRGVQNKHDKNKSALDASVGKFHRMQKEQGTFLGGLRNEVLSGLDDIVYGATDVEIDLMFWLSDKEKKEAKKQVKPTYKTLLGSENTTEKYVEGVGVIPGAIMSLGRSAPPMLAGSMMLPLMFLQSSAGLSKEMNNNPAFNDINEYEKRAITAPIALGEAMLEKLGFEGAMGKSKYVNNLVKRALDDTTVETGVDGLTEILKRHIDNDVAKGILVVGKGAVKGGLSEGATGGMQEISNITGKELYNAIKGKPMFETPKTFWDGVKQVGEAARDEAIGGIILGAVGSVSKAYGKDKLSKIDTKDVVALNAIGNNMEMMDAIESDVQIKVNTGAITPEEGKEQVDAVRNTIGLLNNLPDNLTAEQQKEALPLVQKLRDLEDEKERAGKAKGIVEPIQLKIDAINEKLAAIIKNPKPKDPPAATETITEEETDLQKAVKNHPLVKDKIASFNEEETVEINNDPIAWADRNISETIEDLKYIDSNPSNDFDQDNGMKKWYARRIQDFKNFKKDIQNEINPKEKPKETKTEAQAEPITNEQAQGEKDEVVEAVNPLTPNEELNVGDDVVYNGNKTKITKFVNNITVQLEDGSETNINNLELPIPSPKDEAPSSPIIEEDIMNDIGDEDVADEVTETLRLHGYDSAYLRESEDSEGMLVVFDKDNVKIIKTNLMPTDQIRRGIQKLKDIPNKGIARDITSLPAEVIEALADIAIGYARRGGDAMGEYIKFLRGKYKDYLKNVSDKELETLYKKANGIKTESKSVPKDGQKKKKIVTERAFEGEIRETIKKYLEENGLYRDTFKQPERSAQAENLINDLGEEAALEGVKNFEIRGALATSVLTKLILRNDTEMSLLSATDVDKLDELGKKGADLIILLEREGYFGGELTGQLAYEYVNSDIGYKLNKKVNDWKNAHNGEITPDMLAYFQSLDRELTELKKREAEAEERAKIAEQKLKDAEAIINIKESIEREKKQRVSAKIRQETDRLLKKVQEAKIHRPGMFMSATPASIIWDGAVNAVELSIKGFGRSAEAIAKGVEFIKGSAWYNGLTPSGQDQAIKEFEGWWKEKPKAERKEKDGKTILVIPPSLIRELVANGNDTIEKLVEAVREAIREDVPDAEDREIRDAITGYGNQVNLNNEEIAKLIRKLKRVGRAISGLEDVAAKKRPLRSGMQRDPLDPDERALQKELREAMKDLPMDEQLEAEQQKTATDALKRRLENQIEDLEREIKKKVQVPRSVRTVQVDDDIIRLRELLAAVKKRHDAVFKNEAYEAAKRLEMTKKRTVARIAELQRKIKEKDFTTRKPKPVVEDTELAQIRAEKIRVQNRYDIEFYKDKLLKRTKKEKVGDFAWEFWQLSRAMVATFDFSFMLVQGLVQTVAHPKHAIQAFKQSIQSLASESKTDEFISLIKAQEWYPELAQSKLALTEAHAESKAQEELFFSEWTKLIWEIVGFPFTQTKIITSKRWAMLNPFRALERAAVGYLDTLRVLRWLEGREMLRLQKELVEADGKTFEDYPKAMKEMADVVNTFTGRASLGAATNKFLKGELIAEPLTKMIFSPRNWASMIKTASPYAFYYLGSKRAGAEGWKPSVAQKIALTDYIRFISFTLSTVMMAAFYLNSDDDDETGVEMNPTSSDWLKIKLGRKRLDPWGGRQQEIVMVAKLIAGARGLPIKKTNGEMEQLGTPYGTPTMGGLMIERVANKLSPSAAMTWEYLNTRKVGDKRVNKYGEEWELSSELWERLHPMYFGTVAEIMEDDPSITGGLQAVWALAGGSVNVYEQKGRGPRKRPERPVRPVRPVRTDKE